MDWVQIVAMLFQALIGFAICVWLDRRGAFSAAHSLVREENKQISRPTRRQLIFAYGLSGIVLAMLGLFAVFVLSDAVEDDLWPHAIFLFVVLPVCCIGQLHSMTRWVMWDSTGIETGARFARRRSFAWSDLDSMRYSHLFSCHVLKFGKRKLSVSVMGTGIGGFIAQAQGILKAR